MSNPMVPPLPMPDSDPHDEQVDAFTVQDDDGKPTLDPDIDDALITSASADRIASGAEDEDAL